MPGRSERAQRAQRGERIERKAAVFAEAPRQAPAAAPPVCVTSWVRLPLPNGEFLMRPGKPVMLEEEIGTREAAALLKVSQRTVEAYRDQGVLKEGTDWRRNPTIVRPGKYWIKRTAVMRLRGE